MYQSQAAHQLGGEVAFLRAECGATREGDAFGAVDGVAVSVRGHEGGVARGLDVLGDLAHDEIPGHALPARRARGATGWKSVSWDFVMGKIAQNIKASRDATFVTTDGNGNTVNRTEGIAFAGGAAFSSEEGYFATKLMRGLGLVHLEQQARV